MAQQQQDESKEGKDGKKLHISPSFARRLTRTKGPPQALVKDDSTDEISLPHAEHHKYQTIQSFRPEEVKELLSQHFLDPAVNGRTSVPSEDGVRRFSLVKNNFKVRRAIRNSKDAAMLRGMADEVEGKATSAPDPSHFLHNPDEAQKHANEYSDGELDAPHEIARLRAQLVHERTIYTREMARMRAQLRAFETHLAQTVARMGALLEMVDSREHAVQELLSKSMDGPEEKERQEKDRSTKEKNEKLAEKDKKVDLPTVKTFELLT